MLCYVYKIPKPGSDWLQTDFWWKNEIKMQTAWENVFQIARKDFIAISKVNPNVGAAGFALGHADTGAGLWCLQYQYQYLHRL